MTEPSPSTPPAEEAKSLSWVFRFILITSALYIAGCSAFFSVRGLGLLFVGSDTEVMIMAASLEVGKLVAASFLYRYWDRINSVLRFYLTLAVLILIGITSLGNYGYLARAYEKTTTQINRNELEIATLEKEIADIQHQLDESQGKNNRLNSASREDLSKAQLRLTQATASLEQSLTRLQEQRKAVNERRTQDLAAPTQRATEQSSTIAKSIAAEEAASAKAIAAEETVIAGLNERLKVLDAAVAAYTAQGTSTQYLFFEKDNVKKGQELRDEQRPERDQIAVALANASARIDRGRSEANRRIEQLRTEQSRINESANKDVAQLRQQFASDLAKLDSEEKELRKAGAATIADLEKQIAALQEHDQGKVTMTEAEIETLHKQIHDRNQQIHVLRDAIAGSDIGSYRFVARAFEAEADDVVKWLMLALVSVFDPLAVTLVVAAAVFGIAHLFAALGLALGVWLIVGAFIVLARRWRIGQVSRSDMFGLVRSTPLAVWGLVIAHAGLGVTTVGITAVSAWQTNKVLSMSPGQSVKLAGNTITMVALRPVNGPNYEANQAQFDVVGAFGRSNLTSERRMYPSSQTTTTDAGIGVGILGNIYISVADQNPDGGLTVRMWNHPFVDWIWAGCLLMAFGGAVSLADRSLRVAKVERVVVRPLAAAAEPVIP